MQTAEQLRVTTIVFTDRNIVTDEHIEVQANSDRVVLTDIGVHINDEVGGSVVYPWHRIDHIVKRTVPVP